MNLSSNHLKQILTRIIKGGTREDQDVEVVRKIVLINIISIIGILNLIPLGFAAYMADNPILGFFDHAVAVVLIINQFHLRKTGNHTFSSYFGIACAAALFFYLFVTGGIENTGHVWFYTFPLFSSFLLGSKKGAVATTALLLSAIFFLAINQESSNLATYTTAFKIRFIMSYLVVFAYAYFFETVRESTQQKLTLNNTELEQKIFELKEAEKGVKKAHDELEHRVVDRTSELTIANAQLKIEITERKSSEKTLSKNEKKYRLLADNVSDNIWTLDLENLRFTYSSPSVKHLYGYTPEEMMDLTVKDILIPESFELAMNVLTEEMNKERTGNPDLSRTRTLELQSYRKDRSTVYTEVKMSFLRDEKNKPVGLLGVTREITERKLAEWKLQKAHYELEQRVKERTAQLAEKNESLNQEIEERRRAQVDAETANQSKSVFLANMSHELRTPLNHIIGFTELIVDKNFGDLNNVQEEYLGDVLHSSKHLLSLINDILDLSKVEAGKLEMESSNINLKMVLENSLVMIREKAMKHGIQLSTNIKGIPESITADERKLKQIIYNLLSNAVKFTPDGGEVRLTADLADDSLPAADSSEEKASDQKLRAMGYELNSSQKFVRISVIDTGIGLKQEDLERIFNPFDQVELSASRRYHGTGLGLSLTKNLVELHGGRVWAESEGERRGSRFCFVIPIKKMPEMP